MKQEYLYFAVPPVATLLRLYLLFGMINTAIIFYRHEMNESLAVVR